MFHVSRLRRYILDSSYVIQVDDIQVRENLNIETSPMRTGDHEVRLFHKKEITLVKVVWGGITGGNITWELESQMRESYPT